MKAARDPKLAAADATPSISAALVHPAAVTKAMDCESDLPLDYASVPKHQAVDRYSLTQQ